MYVTNVLSKGTPVGTPQKRQAFLEVFGYSPQTDSIALLLKKISNQLIKGGEVNLILT